MIISHPFTGWCLVTLTMWLMAMLVRAARSRHISAKRLLIDAGMVLLFGALGFTAAITLIFMLQQERWQYVSLMVASAPLIIAPFFLGGLYAGERVHQQLFRPGHALISFLLSTAITLMLAISFFKLINGPDGGSTGGWEPGFIALFVLCPLLWICAFIGLYFVFNVSSKRPGSTIESSC